MKFVDGTQRRVSTGIFEVKTYNANQNKEEGL